MHQSCQHAIQPPTYHMLVKFLLINLPFYFQFHPRIDFRPHIVLRRCDIVNLLQLRFFTAIYLLASIMTHNTVEAIPFLLHESQFNSLSSSENDWYSFSVDEGMPPGCIVGHLTDKITDNSVKFTIPRNQYFGITNSSILQVIGSLDRDQNPQLCSTNRSTVDLQCRWKSFVITSTGVYFDLIIQINDLNDNVPRWLESKLKINIPEEQESLVSVELPTAIDSDLGMNGIQKYALHSIDNSSFFKLIVDDKQEPPKLSLLTTERLDREVKSSYLLLLLAMDGSEPYHTGSLTIEVDVVDENDHEPVFSSPKYQAFLSENSEIGTNINLRPLRPNDSQSDYDSLNYQPGLFKGHHLATDLDDGLNGQLDFSFAASTDSEVLSTFKLDQKSGKLSTLKPLSYESGPKSWQFVILASDNGRPSRSTSARVEIKLKDANTHKPELTYHIPERFKRTSFAIPDGINISTDRLIHVSENLDLASIGKEPLVTLSVIDRDQGPGGEFECHLTPTHHKVDSMFAFNKTGQAGKWIVYAITITASIDREEIGKLNVRIDCRDHGTPQLESSVEFVLLIEDVNDNPPVFTQQIYTFRAREENSVNSSLGQVQATDLDQGDNGRVKYSIQWPYSTDCVFKVDKDGRLFSLRPLDRETAPNGYNFKIFAVDSANPPNSLTGSADVRVLIDDINDCQPRFSQPEYNFTIEEDFDFDFQGDRRVGEVMATDCDIGINAVIRYSLLEKDHPFKIDQKGSITSIALIDRERQASFRLTVVATNQDDDRANRRQSFTIPPRVYPKNRLRLSSISRVQIVVNDLNDNSPKFIHPNSTDYALQLSIHEPIGFLVTRLLAVDSDAGQNGLVSYSIVEGNHLDLVSLAKHSGELSVGKELAQYENQTINLLIGATDSGSPTSLQSLTNLRLLLRDTDPIGQFGDINSHLNDFVHQPSAGDVITSGLGSIDFNKLIVIGTSLATAVVFLILLVAIVLFIRRTTCCRRRSSVAVDSSDQFELERVRTQCKQQMNGSIGQSGNFSSTPVDHLDSQSLFRPCQLFDCQSQFPPIRNQYFDDLAGRVDHDVAGSHQIQLIALSASTSSGSPQIGGNHETDRPGPISITSSDCKLHGSDHFRFIALPLTSLESISTNLQHSNSMQHHLASQHSNTDSTTPVNVDQIYFPLESFASNTPPPPASVILGTALKSDTVQSINCPVNDTTLNASLAPSCCSHLGIATVLPMTTQNIHLIAPQDPRLPVTISRHGDRRDDDSGPWRPINPMDSDNFECSQ